MSEKIVTRVLPKLKVARTSYLAKESFLSSLEGKSRKLFSPESLTLGHTAAANYLRGEENGKTAFEIVVSPEKTKFLQSLSSSPEENFRQIVFSSRIAMENLLEEIGAKNARWVGVFHQNTNHTHLHILIGEEYTDDLEQKKAVRRIPKNLLYKDEDNLSLLDRKFLKAFKEHFIVKPLDTPTILNEDSGRLLANLNAKYKAEAFIALMEKTPFSLSVVNQASENGTLLSDENAQPIFIRRNKDGVATGLNWFDDETKNWRRTGFENGGWFFIGDSTKAESIILVSSPEEALALQTLHSERNLEKVAIIALEPRNFDLELADLLIQRQRELGLQNKELNVVWATSKNQKGVQISSGLNELKEHTEKCLRYENLAKLNFTPNSRQTSWTKQLQIVTDAAEIINIINPNQTVNRIPIPQDIEFTPVLPEINRTESINLLNEETSGDNYQPEEAAKISFQELTTRARNIPLESIATAHGLQKTLLEGELLWQDTARTRSLKISGNLFSDRQNGMEGGRGAIDLVAYLQDLPPSETFKAARAWLIDQYNLNDEPNELIVNQKTLLMPPRIEENLEQVRFYLEESRGISYQTINKFIENELLYANSFSSAVFVYRDLQGHKNGASWRDTTQGSGLRGNAPGTETEKGYFYIGNPHTAQKFILTEAPIDLLSYYEIESLNASDLSQTVILSLGGKPAPSDLLEHLSRRQITLAEAKIPLEIIYANDDNRSGEKAFDRFLEKFEEIAPDLFAEMGDELPEKVNLVRVTPPLGKDWNEYLKILTSQEEYPTLEEIREHRLEIETDLTRNSELLENNKLEQNLSPKEKESSISEIDPGEKKSEENYNETRVERTENGGSPAGLGTDGNGLSGGIDSQSLPTSEGGRDTFSNIEDLGGEGGEDLSGSLQREQEPLGSDGIGESGDQTRAGSGGLGNQLIEEKVYQFKIRREGDEFLQYKIGLNEKGEWETTAAGKIGSKDQSAKKTQLIELSAKAFSSEKLTSLTQAVVQINSQIELLDNNANEYSPLYREIYQFNREFLASLTPQIEAEKDINPSEIRSIYQNEQGFKVVFNDQKYTRSFSFRDEDGNILDRETVREKARDWRKIIVNFSF